MIYLFYVQNSVVDMRLIDHQDAEIFRYLGSSRLSQENKNMYAVDKHLNRHMYYRIAATQLGFMIFSQRSFA
jgi:hypothetical protein